MFLIFVNEIIRLYKINFQELYFLLFIKIIHLQIDRSQYPLHDKIV